MPKTLEELYQEREKRFNDVVHLKVPDRIPIALLSTLFGASYGGISYQEAMHD